MRIVLSIHHDLDPNKGAPGVIYQLAEQYRRLGHEVTPLSWSDLPSHWPEMRKKLLFPRFMARRLAELERNGKIDVIDASSGDLWFWLARGGKRRTGALVVTRSLGLEHVMHDQLMEEVRRKMATVSWRYPLYHGGFRLWEEASTFRGSDLVLVLSEPDREYLATRLGIPLERSRAVPHGVPESFLNLPLAPTAAEPDAPIGIAQVSTFIRRKGIEYGIPALNTILRRYPNVRFAMFGTTVPDDEVLSRFDSDLRPRVTAVRRFDRAELPRLLSAFHIKLFPSLSEGFSLALTEAMACGLAPVASAIPGNLEIVRDGKNGLIVPTSDAGAIERALDRLLQDRPLLARLRCAAYETAQEYSWRQVARVNLQRYDEALKSSKRTLVAR